MTTTEPIDTTGAEAEPDPEAPPAEEAPPAPEPEEAPTPEPAEEPPAADPAPEPVADLPVRAAEAPRVPGLAIDIPIVPSRDEMRVLAEQAVILANSASVPKALRGNPNDTFLVLLTGRDLGVALTTALREVHVIDGKPTVSPKLKNALIKQSGIGRIYQHQAPRPDPKDPEKMLLCPCGSTDGPNDHTRATWHAERFDEPGILHTSTFTVEDAMRAETRENGQNITLDKKSNWRSYPQRMLSWRAAGYLSDDVFPEVATGLYSPDELGSVTDENGEPIPVNAVEVPAGFTNRTAPRTQPSVERPDDATRAELGARLAKVKENDEAHAEMSKWWSERNLPPWRHDDFSSRHAVTVLARLNAIETKYGIEQAAEGQEAGSDAEEPPPGAPEGDAPELPAGTPEAAEAGEVSSTFAAEPEERTGSPSEEDLAEMARLRDDGEVVPWLIARARFLNEASIRSYAVTQGLEAPKAGNLNGYRRWWCEQEIERFGSAVVAVLSTVFRTDPFDAYAS